jgi:hypothetical protein
MGRGHAAAPPTRRGLIDAGPAGRQYSRRATTTVPIVNSSNTATDAESADTVIRLRGWGSECIHTLPPPTQNAWLIGTSSVCALRLNDPQVAPEHVLLTHEDGQWWLQALGTANSVRQDGVSRRRFSLTSGTEIGIGMTTLVAESLRAAQLRDFCRRLLGWGADRLGAVDRALRAIRLARTGHNPLVLCGENDLVPIAHALHRYTLKGSVPFILCDRHRKHPHASFRFPANIPRGVDALTAANGGTLCIRTSSLPHDIDEVMRRLYEPGCHVQLFLCMQYGRRKTFFAGAQPIEIPSLQGRDQDLARIIQEFAQDAITSLGVPHTAFLDEDSCWVLENAEDSIPEIQKATLRVVAVRASRNVSQAAALLGIKAISLSHWLDRRGQLPFGTAMSQQPGQARTRPREHA